MGSLACPGLAPLLRALRPAWCVLPLLLHCMQLTAMALPFLGCKGKHLNDKCLTRCTHEQPENTPPAD